MLRYATALVARDKIAFYAWRGEVDISKQVFCLCFFRFQFSKQGRYQQAGPHPKQGLAYLFIEAT